MLTRPRRTGTRRGTRILTPIPASSKEDKTEEVEIKKEDTPIRRTRKVVSTSGKRVSTRNIKKLPEKSEKIEETTKESSDGSLMWKSFKRDYQILYPSNSTLKYDSKVFGKGIHWGQRKLALAVLHFLNLYWNSKDRPEIIYAGAAPGTNINFLVDLYPEAVWHLYDPRAITNVESSQNVKIYDGENGWFTDEVAETWGKAVKDGKKVLFISDIRREDTSKVSEKTEKSVWEDMQFQQKWVQLIRPVAAHLKFRLPYPGYQFDDEINIEEGEAPYLAGTLYLQPWPKSTSGESRLVVTPDKNGNYPIHYWDLTRHESQMYYHNIVTRSEQQYYNPVYEVTAEENDEGKTDKLKRRPVAGPQLLNNWDSLMEYSIFNDYLITRNADNRHEKITVLSDILSERINIKVAGVEMITLEKLRKDPMIIKRGIGGQIRKKRTTRKSTRKR